MKNKWITIGILLTAVGSQGAERTAGYNADRNAYFGDLHVHTKNSSGGF